MSELLAGLEARLVAILEEARGASGLGADAAARHVPAGRYRRAPSKAALRDPALEPARFDRAYELAWLGTRDEPDPPNPLDPSHLLRVRVDLVVGYLYGDARAALAVTVGSETGAADVQVAGRRALADARRLMRAISFPDIFQDAADDPALVDLRAPDGEGPRTEDLGGGRLLLTVPLEALLWATASSSYDP